MADGIIQVEGINELEAKLSTLDASIQKQFLREGLDAAAEIILKAAAASTNFKDASGATVKSLKIRPGKGRQSGEIVRLISVGEGWFRGKTFYAAFVHMGHKIGSRKLGDARKSVAPNAWMKRGFDASKQQAVETAMELVKSRIEGSGK